MPWVLFLCSFLLAALTGFYAENMGVFFRNQAVARLLGLFCFALIGYAFWRRADKRSSPAAWPGKVSTMEEERRVIARMIAEVERSFEAGDLTEDERRRRLSVLSSRLASLTGQ